MTIYQKPNAFYYIISVFFLLWNLIGVAFFFVELLAPDMVTQAMSEEQVTLYNSRPVWYMTNYGVAVFGGIAACIALLIKNKFAVIVAFISFFALVISTAYNFYAGSWNMVGTGDRVMFLLVPFLGLLLYLYTRFARAKGWLK
jgi:hypothetical protein